MWDAPTNTGLTRIDEHLGDEGSIARQPRIYRPAIKKQFKVLDFARSKYKLRLRMANLNVQNMQELITLCNLTFSAALITCHIFC